MIEVKFNEADNTACLSCEGKLTLEDIVQGVRDWIAHKDYAADIDILCDVAQAQWQQAISEFLQVSDAVVERVNQQWQGHKIAIVTSSYTEIALIESHLGEMGWKAQWRGFMNTTQAQQWLLGPVPESANAC